MTEFLGTFEIVRTVLRVGIFALAVATAVLALLAWAVRTRRLSPFGALARFSRNSIDPLMRPVERRLVRAGGQPRNAPWFALLFVIVAGLVVMYVFDVIVGMLVRGARAASSSPGAMFTVLLDWTFGLLELALIVRVISSWFRISPYSRLVRWSFVLTEWLIAPLRRVIPTIGMIDITPLVAFFVLQVLQWIIVQIVLRG